MIDPIVLMKPFVSAPMIWTLAQDPSDVWTEYQCTLNEEPFHMQNMDPELRKKIEAEQQR